MQISLETLRSLLRSTFGRNSFIASFVTSIESSSRCSTASIDSKGRLLYNPEFIEQYVKQESDLFCLLIHELLHPLFGHFIYRSGKLENIAADSIINACISQVFAKWSDSGSLFRRFYPEKGLEGILRPNSDMRYSRYQHLYQRLYPELPGRSLSTGEVIRTLKVLVDQPQVEEVTLLGNHQSNGDSSTDAIGQECSSKIAESIHQLLREQGDKVAGHSQQLLHLLMEVLEQHRSLKKTLLERFTTRSKWDRFKAMMHQPQLSRSPVPISPGKRDYVLLASGHTPFQYRYQRHQLGHEEMGLAIYLDVSGSVESHLPDIIAILQSLQASLNTIFLFSNEVVEVPFKQLLQGKIETTYGTDFDCVAEHILEHRFDKVIVMTDGYASMKQENLKALQDRKVMTLTVLLEHSYANPPWQELGEVMQLDEVVV